MRRGRPFHLRGPVHKTHYDCQLSRMPDPRFGIGTNFSYGLSRTVSPQSLLRNENALSAHWKILDRKG